ncbi:MAG: fused MFS/spermidine synthase, partial [Phycisphaerae bacterium]|nr:fused MFS/spermidine synthase [Phycisphaerae bacterium]
TGFLQYGVVFSATVLWGALLLFQVQPLLGRDVLPWFGGTPEVWTTCMLFFQLFLLAGYLYAHFLIRIRNPRIQAALHIAGLAGALLFLPILPSDNFKPTPNSNPLLQILLICTLTVGLPYLMLASASPLIGAWFAKTFPAKNPYRLYALSNAGSLLGLMGFPFVFEPFFTRLQTVYLWSAAFAVFAVLFAACMLLAGRAAPVQPAAKSCPSGSKRQPERRWLWLALPAAAVVELLAVTNKITQDITVIPFLWVLPLSIYLLSFIICFDHQRWYKRSVFLLLFILGMGGIMYVHLFEEGMSAYTLVGIYVFMLLGCCMVCHGELYRLRPAQEHLTVYYLMIAAGGAMGGFFVAVICPVIFNVYIELYLGLLVCACLLLLADQSLSAAGARRRPFWIAAVFVVGLLGIFLMGQRTSDSQRSIENSRNFFGVLGIWEEAWDNPADHKLLMQHGTTFHGLQFQSAQKRHLATAYYSPDSGIGLLLRHLPKQENRRIGIVGLGVGTLAAYGHPGDTLCFYEINPDVERLARKYFTYLSDCPAQIDIVKGDARLSMEHQPSQNFDVLAIDAFSSDAIPVHLLTAEAMAIYLKHLAPEGVLAFHISTMHLDLHSVIWKLADHFGLKTAWIESYKDDSSGALDSDWILLAQDDRFLGSEAIRLNASPQDRRRKDVLLWTDDHINLLQILKKNPLSR